MVKTHESARMILVFDTFSMVNFVLPPFPAMRPMARERWSPFSGLTVENKQKKILIKSPCIFEQSKTQH